MGDVIAFPSPAIPQEILPLVPYDNGCGLLFWLPPSHPFVRDTPEAAAVRKEWDRHNRASGRPLL